MIAALCLLKHAHEGDEQAGKPSLWLSNGSARSAREEAVLAVEEAGWRVADQNQLRFGTTFTRR